MNDREKLKAEERAQYNASFDSVRIAVSIFRERMLGKLIKNQHKGNRDGWLKDTPEALLERLQEELDELKLAVAEGDPENIADEAADVANFAMMVADLVFAKRAP